MLADGQRGARFHHVGGRLVGEPPGEVGVTPPDALAECPCQVQGGKDATGLRPVLHEEVVACEVARGLRPHEGGRVLQAAFRIDGQGLCDEVRQAGELAMEPSFDLVALRQSYGEGLKNVILGQGTNDLSALVDHRSCGPVLGEQKLSSVGHGAAGEAHHARSAQDVPHRGRSFVDHRRMLFRIGLSGFLPVEPGRKTCLVTLGGAHD
mmetsp:Transcript_17974/g.51848  ORF Transcript_17974/g.51848 Transcript_17974/m.51848 type:complete len:208 (-) Transcript_17974:51-674(-)